MNAERSAAIDWPAWLARWDAQQTGYLPDREARFSAMFDALEVLLGSTFSALDVACGPGSLSRRLLARFPTARVTAVDLDPVLLAMGKACLGTMDGRLTWIEADLNEETWPEALPERPVDAALSTTAIHWLPPGRIVTLYRVLASVIRPGGVLLNGDNMRFPPQAPSFRKLAQTIADQRLAVHRARPSAQDWETYWTALRAEPALAALFAERDRRFDFRPADREAAVGSTTPRRKNLEAVVPTTLDLHRAALIDAGFQEVDVLWQSVDNRVLMAVR